MFATRSNPILGLATRAMLNQSSMRTHFKPNWTYNDRYEGKFDYHDREKYPRKMAVIKEEELLDDVHSIRALEIENPSPFHVVRRVRPMTKIAWSQKVTLRRLNLHSSRNGECVIVPNTPQFNALLAQVKHLLYLKPATFADGRIPTEEDIGAIKVCPYTGHVQIDERLRLLSKRLNQERPLLFQGNHLRFKIAKEVGLHHPHYMR